MKTKLIKRLLVVGGSVVLIVLVAFSISFIRFYNLNKKYNKLQKGIDNHFVFFNIGNGDRLYLIKLIDSISVCNPKVIGIDVFFTEQKDTAQDSILADCIKTSGAVLAARHDGARFFDVHPMFMRSARKVGYAQSNSGDNFVIEFIPFINSFGVDHYHFAYQIALAYDKKKASDFLSEMESNAAVEVEFRRLDDQFRKYDFNDLDFDCSEIQGKIAYLGYLGPTDEDKHFTISRYFHRDRDKSGPDMYGSTIVANQVLMILEGENR